MLDDFTIMMIGGFSLAIVIAYLTNSKQRKLFKQWKRKVNCKCQCTCKENNNE